MRGISQSPAHIKSLPLFDWAEARRTAPPLRLRVWKTGPDLLIHSFVWEARRHG